MFPGMGTDSDLDKTVLNSFSASGYILRQPHLGQSRSGDPVAHLVISVMSGTVKNDDGYYPSIVVEVSFWGQSSQTVMNYTKKGQQISFSGQLTGISTYQREDGSIGATLKATGHQLQLQPRAAAEAAPAPAPEPAEEAPAKPGATRSRRTGKPVVVEAMTSCDFPE